MDKKSIPYNFWTAFSVGFTILRSKVFTLAPPCIQKFGLEDKEKQLLVKEKFAPEISNML